MHQALHGPAIQRDVEAVAGDAAHEALVDLAHVRLQEGALAQQHHLPLRPLRQALAEGAAGGDAPGARRVQRVRLAFQQCLERAVHHQVGVAADGRGEVAVARRRQAIVAQVLGAVDGLRHRAEQLVVDHALLRMAPHLFNDARQALRRDLLAEAHVQADVVHEHGELAELVQARRFVHAIDAPPARLSEHARHRLVGGDHELLDHHVADVALGPDDRIDVALEVHHDLGFGEVEVERAAREPHLPQAVEALLHQLDS